MSHRPNPCHGLWAPIGEGPLSIGWYRVEAYFCCHLLPLLSALAPVQSRPVFALLICNFITRSLFALWQPLSRVPVLKTKLKLNLCSSQQRVSMLLLPISKFIWRTICQLFLPYKHLILFDNISRSSSFLPEQTHIRRHPCFLSSWLKSWVLGINRWIPPCSAPEKEQLY